MWNIKYLELNLHKQPHYTKSHTLFTLIQVHTLQKITPKPQSLTQWKSNTSIMQQIHYTQAYMQCGIIFSEKPRQAPRSTWQDMPHNE